MHDPLVIEVILVVAVYACTRGVKILIISTNDQHDRPAR